MAGASGAELLLYGDIADRSWWKDDVTPKQFAEDLSGLGAVSEITVRINSPGGDVFAAQAIGNLLEQHGAEVTARIDGLCGSAATVVACHCDRVVAANDSTYMIHPVKMGICGYVDSRDLAEYQEALAAIRENIVGLYAKKTGRDKEEVAAWMDATSWWTGEQAKAYGFVDELADDGVNAAVENRGGILFVGSVNTHLPFAQAPGFVQNSLAAPGAGQGSVNKGLAEMPEERGQEEKDMGMETVDDLRRQYPALVDQIEQAAAQQAREQECRRIQDIEEMALPGSEELAAKAKFVEPISAGDYAKAAMKLAKAQGGMALNALRRDAMDSGVHDVGPNTGSGKHGGDEFLNAIRGLKDKV